MNTDNSHLKFYSQKKGLDRLAKSFSLPPSSSPYPPPIVTWDVDTLPYRQTVSPSSLQLQRSPGLPRHPYRHHTRATAYSNDLLFLTNVPLLPPPDSVVYTPHSSRNLSGWERALGDNPDLWKEGKSWARVWNYYSAVDGDWRTAFRSPEVVRKDDYIGLDLLSQTDVVNTPVVVLHFVLEHSQILVPGLRVETSVDGHDWQTLNTSPQQHSSSSSSSSAKPGVISCHTTGHLSTLPHPSFPQTFLTSKTVQSIIDSESRGQGASSNSWWNSVFSGKARSRLANCQVEVPTSSGGGQRRRGWRFVRLRSELDLMVGWGVYEIWVE